MSLPAFNPEPYIRELVREDRALRAPRGPARLRAFLMSHASPLGIRPRSPAPPSSSSPLEAPVLHG